MHRRRERQGRADFPMRMRGDTASPDASNGRYARREGTDYLEWRFDRPLDSALRRGLAVSRL